jgi:predicted glycoside hydrolase/deacetylase ChbG (UPF0249 family)
VNHCLFAAALCGWVLAGPSLLPAAEPSAKRQLIIHADDAGMSHSVNRATIEALERGLVTSVSIMVPCPWFPEFAEYARQHPEGCYGIHLTLNAEWNLYRWGPVAPREDVPSLVDEQGFLWANVGQVAARAKASEVRRELRAQIERARRFGVPLSHLDTHMGALVSRPDLLEVYVELGLEYDLPVLFLRELNAESAGAYPVLAAGRARLQPLLEERRLPMLDTLLQFYDGTTHEQRRERYLNALRDLPAGVTQLIVHCGYDDEELRAITGSAPRRDGDRRIFTEPAVRDLLEEGGVELTSWKKLREAAAGAATR